MANWVWFVAGLWLLICVVSIVRVAMIIFFRAHNTLRPVTLDELPDDRPVVHLIVPARNEELDLDASLNALRRQTYDRLKITVVNDRSEDGTAQIAERHAADDPRLSVLNITDLPSGWTGKAHAMFSAAKQAAGDWFCFVDVDVTLEPEAITSTVHAALKRGVEVFTMFPRSAREGFWQQIGVPYLGSLLMIFFDPFRVNDPKQKTGFVNGQFLLIKAETYRALDGHRAVRDYVIEDVPFGQLAKQQGAACYMGLGPLLATVRMYRDCRSMVTGFARILWGALKSRFWMLVAFGVLLVALLPWVAGCLLAAHWIGGGPLVHQELVVLSVLCGVQLLSGLAFNHCVWTGGGLSGWWVLSYPLALLLSLYTLGRACALAGRSLNWRNVEYQVDATGKIVAPPGEELQPDSAGSA